MKTCKNLSTRRTLLIAATAATIALPQLAHADVVYLNNQPLATRVAPIQRNGRTLVPMRDIFEALGATVRYNRALRSITGRRGTTRVALTLGSRQAFVNNQPVMLDTAPTLFGGSTLVPMRFIAESLGAQVTYDGVRRIAFISTRRNDGRMNGGRMNESSMNGGEAEGGTQVAAARTISVPAGVVVPVTLDQDITSATAKRGDTFTATVSTQRAGDSEFPEGTRFEGVVREATAKQGDQPGVLDLDFQAAVLPDGTRYPLGAQLVDLSDNRQISDDGRGRITAAGSGNKNTDRLKVIGVGAAAGYVLGKVILKKNGTLSAVLGGLGGLLYGEQKRKGTREAMLSQGAKLGVRLDRPVTYADASGYIETRRTYTAS